jgi:hypothetical protein
MFVVIFIEDGDIRLAVGMLGATFGPSMVLATVLKIA